MWLFSDRPADANHVDSMMTGTMMRRGEIPEDVRRRVLERDNYQCRVCGDAGDNKLHINHLVLRSQGGTDDDKWLMTFCVKCHAWFHDRRADFVVVHDETGKPEIFVRRAR